MTGIKSVAGLSNCKSDLLLSKKSGVKDFAWMDPDSDSELTGIRIQFMFFSSISSVPYSGLDIKKRSVQVFTDSVLVPYLNPN